jgi:DNA-directed RNA polymerase subunit RPC12/RpoP
VSELRYAGGCWVHDDSDAEPMCDMCEWFCPECDGNVEMDHEDDELVCPECETRINCHPTRLLVEDE